MVFDPMLASSRSKIAGQISAGLMLGYSMAVCNMVVCVVRVRGFAHWYRRLGDISMTVCNMVVCVVRVRGFAHWHRRLGDMVV